MKKSLCTVALLLLAGISITTLPACVTSKDRNDDEQEEPTNQAQDLRSEDLEQGSEVKEKLPHPKEPTAWATKNLIITTPQPAPDYIYSCFNMMTALAKEAGNPGDLLKGEAALQEKVQADLRTYHFCFYQMMLRLDDNLAKGGPLMSSMAQTFFQTMKELWLLARALDKTTSTPVYFTYLKKRYIELSKTYFGRDVIEVGPIFGGSKIAP